MCADNSKTPTLLIVAVADIVDLHPEYRARGHAEAALAIHGQHLERSEHIRRRVRRYLQAHPPLVEATGRRVGPPYVVTGNIRSWCLARRYLRGECVPALVDTGPIEAALEHELAGWLIFEPLPTRRQLSGCIGYYIQRVAHLSSLGSISAWERALGIRPSGLAPRRRGGPKRPQSLGPEAGDE
ncbi:hypothetical protein [Salinisphaera dokdonensis]|uniref:hypothetical protein n=1 Tax=Salinisphaera dokdonensis TaxID=454598 RepID=UPI00334283EB